MFDVLIQRTNIGSNNQTKDKRKANDAAGKDAGKKWWRNHQIDERINHLSNISFKV